MASKVTCLVRKARSMHHLINDTACRQTFITAKRYVNTSFHGPIPPEPIRKRFSMPIVLVCITVGIVVGSYSAKSFAEFLEETDLFVPSDDDD